MIKRLANVIFWAGVIVSLCGAYVSIFDYSSRINMYNHVGGTVWLVYALFAFGPALAGWTLRYALSGVR